MKYTLTFNVCVPENFADERSTDFTIVDHCFFFFLNKKLFR